MKEQTDFLEQKGLCKSKEKLKQKMFAANKVRIESLNVLSNAIFDAKQRTERTFGFIVVTM